jgi:uncharacterized membrane protein
MFSMLRDVLSTLSVFCIGMVAGLMFGTGLAAYTAKGLPEKSYTLRFQLEDALFAKAMPPLMLATLILLAAAATLSAGGGRLLFAAAALLMLTVLFVTVRFEIPLNREIQSWTAGAAPATWSAVRDRWLANHLVRTIAATGSFVCAILALLQR